MPSTPAGVGRSGMGRTREQRASAPEDGIDARTLPHNLEAERNVLGALLVDNSQAEALAPLLSGRDFYRDAHRRLYEAMGRLFERRVAVDFTTLREELARTGELAEVG